MIMIEGAKFTYSYLRKALEKQARKLDVIEKRKVWDYGIKLVKSYLFVNGYNSEKHKLRLKRKDIFKNLAAEKK